VAAAILDREPPPLERYAPGTPESLQWILTKVLAKERDERYQTVKDLALDLKRLKQWLENRADAEPAGERETPSAKPAAGMTNRRKGAVALALAGLLIGAAAIVYLGPWARRGSRDDQPPVQRALSRVTFDAGLQSEATWSPDGRFIAYSSDRSGNLEINVQPIGEGNPVQVTHSAAHDRQPDWSPDGNRIAFRSEREGGGLYVVPALGGSERRISSFGYYPRWSPDGTQILFISSDVRMMGSFPKVWVVGLDGNPPREVLAGFINSAGYEQFGFRHLAWHPDGRVSILARHRSSGLGLWTVPLAGGAAVKSELAPKVEQQIQSAAVDFQRFSWAASGRALYFEGNSRGVTNLWKVTVDPKGLIWRAGPERLTTGAGADTDISLSADGKKLAFTTHLESTRVWTLPFDAATGRLGGEGQPVTPAGVNASVLDLTRDGKRLAYLAERPGKQELWEKSLEDGGEKLLVADDNAQRGYLVWSRDGTRLAYYRVTRPGANAIIVLPGGGGDEQVIVPADYRQGPKSWSADGQWILSVTTRPPSERWKIWLVPVAAAPHAETQARIVAAHPDYNLYQAQFSPDERWIAFMAVKANDALASTICVMPAGGGEWRRLTDGKYLDDKLRWSPDGRMIYFTSSRGGFTNVWGVRFDPVKGQSVGEPLRVTKFENPNKLLAPPTRTSEISLSADRLALPIMEISGSIWILENVDR
jgi:Tol biopolymer transport system component